MLLMTLLDAIASWFAYPAALLLKRIRLIGVHKLPRCKDALLKAGLFPIANHYYEPRFDYRGYDPHEERHLPGLAMNATAQLELLHRFMAGDELKTLGDPQGDPDGFHFGNSAFEPGDAEVWYQVIRHFKPARIYEIGSGFSTRIARRAIERNIAETPTYRCDHVCVEPYEMPWLERSGARVIRQRVEALGWEFFSALQENDILFIDSSHIIRPGGDVLFEYLELLPRLKPGTLVHIHDIFTPRDYPREWREDQVLFWNEQYLLEAFLSGHHDWEVVLALNFLQANHHAALAAVAPHLRPRHVPASFYMRRMRGDANGGR